MNELSEMVLQKNLKANCLESLILIGSAMFGVTFNMFTRVRLPLFLKH